MKSIRSIFAAAGILLSGATEAVSAQFAGFDCVSGPFTGSVAIADGYAGFSWDNFYTVDGAAASDFFVLAPGYANGVVSAPCVALNGYGGDASITSATPFTFNGGFFTAAFYEDLTLDITAFSGSNQVFQTAMILNTSTPQELSVTWDGIDRIEFASGDGNLGSQFVFDNFRFNGATDPSTSTVPEPATMTLLATGLAGLAATRRRRTTT